MTSPVQQLRDQVTKELHGSVTIIVLGASGDLAKKKTFPALFGLFRHGFLPENTQIVGYARTQMTHEDYLGRVTQYIKAQDCQETLEKFKKITSYVSGQYDDDKSWQHLDSALRESEQKRGLTVGKKHRIFYMALPPSVFIPVAKGLKHNVYSKEGSNRLVVEKPFGMDLESANHLGKELGALFTEDEIFRIDHYLGKEMVKNVMNVRFANIFFSNVWDRNNINNVQITFKEPFGTEGRGGYFDQTGIIRDVMQNRKFVNKRFVLKCIRPIELEDALLGQYVAADGKPGYLEDETLKNKDSLTPTFAALVCKIHNERWEDVPFILKAGKALNEAKVEIRIQFRHVPGNLYKESSRNELVMRIQPKEALYMKFNNKQPGLSYQTIQTDLDLSYHDRYTDLHIPDAYESLILDVLRNDHSNFVRDDELEAAWKIFTPLLHKIDGHANDVQVKQYAYGSRGPAELDSFVKKHGYDRAQADYSWPLQSVAGNNKL
ncbi:Glucose-6-phosphate 1-dehydrogenase [Apophysomyces sp. BC1034]|nr:Glucose-6-phosphate 1-dehydrogenase [Apophysomyces sp. BC1034]